MDDRTGPILAGIFIAPARGAPMQACRSVWAEAGRGLVGDRYHAGTGTFSGRYEVKPGVREVSLIDAQAVVECRRRLKADIGGADLRRNLVIADLPAADLRESVIRIGDTRLEILGYCPPCAYLSRLLHLDMRRGLAYIGGMRARIVAGGQLAQGARVTIDPPGACG